MPVATPQRRTLCVRIVANDGTTYRVAAEYPVDLLMSNSTVYEGGNYTTTTAVSSVADGGPMVIDFGSVYGPDAIDRDEIVSGKWDGAWVYAFRTDWAVPVEDEEPLGVFQLGKMREEDERYVIEMMGLRDLLNQSTGRIHKPTCDWVFADSHIDGTIIASDKSRCKIPGVAVTRTVTIVEVTDNMQFRISEGDGYRSDDYYGNGEIIFNTGPNAGLSYRIIKTSFSDGRLILTAPFYYPPQVGDSIDVRAGCRKRFLEDCVQGKGNGRNFGGFPHVPQQSTVSKFGDQ